MGTEPLPDELHIAARCNKSTRITLYYANICCVSLVVKPRPQPLLASESAYSVLLDTLPGVPQSTGVTPQLKGRDLLPWKRANKHSLSPFIAGCMSVS